MAAIAYIALSPPVATAQVVEQGESSAYDLNINVGLNVPLVGTAQANVGPLVESQGSGPPDYDDPGTLANASLDTTVGVVQVLGGSTGLLNTEASGEFGVPGPENGETFASSTINDLALSIADPVIGFLNPLVTLSAGTIESTASVTAMCEPETPLVAAGTTTLEDAALALNLLGVSDANVDLEANPAANTVVLDVDVLVGSVEVILNRQVVSTTPASASISVDAIYIAIDVAGLVTAEITIGHSEASTDCNLETVDLSVTKTADPNPVVVGEDLTYEIVVVNNGYGTADNVVVTDDLPDSVTFQSVTPGAPDCEETAGTIECEFATLGPGESETITILVTPTEIGLLENTASATADGEEGAEDTVTTSVTALPAFACTTTAFLAQGIPTNLYEVDLVTGEYGGAPVASDIYPENINAIGFNPLDGYIYGWIHSGDDEDRGIARIGSDYSVENLGYPTNWDSFATLGASHHIGDFDDQGHLWLSSGVNGYWVEIDLEPGSPTYMTVLSTGPMVPPLGGYGFADWGFNPSDGLFYVTVTSGGDPTANIRLWSFDPADGSMTDRQDLGDYPTGSMPYGGAVYTDAANNLFTSNNDTGEIWRTQLPDGPSTYLADGPASTSNDGAICFNIVIPADGPIVEITKEANTDEALGPGDSVTYTVTVTNTGDDAATDLVVTDELPEGIESGTWTCSGADCPNASGEMPLNETIPSLGAGETVVYVIEATVGDDPPPAIVNVATADGPNLTCEDGSEPPCEAIFVNPALPLVTVEKTADTDEAEPGDTVTYEIVVSNVGQADLDGEVVVTDEGADGLESATWTCEADGGAVCPNASGELPLEETVTTLPAGGSLTYTIVGVVSDDPPAEIVNTATVDGPIICYIDGEPSDPPCEVTVTVEVPDDDPPPTPTPTATASPTPTATASPTPTATASPTPTATASPTPTATASPTPTVTATASPTATVSPTASPTSPADDDDDDGGADDDDGRDDDDDRGGTGAPPPASTGSGGQGAAGQPVAGLIVLSLAGLAALFTGLVRMATARR